MRKGDIVLTPIGNALYGGIPSLVVDADKTGISVWTGKFLLKYEKKDLAAHGRVRKIKTYRTNKHNEFSQFKVNFGEEDFIVDVKISDFLFKIDELRKVAFVKALEKRASDKMTRLEFLEKLRDKYINKGYSEPVARRMAANEYMKVVT